ncbi:ABC transporter [Bradyrhizobium hipponense]|uniref:ABC transporter n=1 Tax=Bradyrhizobium hipponense TaxID=2605638 RepID=A0A5S4YR94_9BRAD|nr:ABC transporter [Bradyrhizobium hipponense]
MPGLVPGIHVSPQSRMRVDGRDRPDPDDGLCGAIGD